MLPAVEAFALTKRYGAHLALAEVSLRVEAGEFLTLLGPSGCGKTTLLRLIAGLTAPDAGQIYLAGQEVTHLPAYRRPVHTVFQSYALFPHLNAYDNIAFGLARKGHAPPAIQQRVEALLALVGLEGIAYRYPQELSGGQQQRVALARALACEPPVLLLDEPLAALDPHLRRHMQRELKALQHQLGTTFVLVTHDQTEALMLSDRIAVLRRGRILQTGTPQTLHDEPETAFVASFIGNCNLLHGRLHSLQPPEAGVIIGGAIVTARCRHRDVKPGQPITLAVRPESLRLETATSDSGLPPNQLTGVVTERLYVGAETHWTVCLPDGQTLVAALRPETPPTRAVGSKVHVRWQTSQAVVVKPDDAANDASPV
ncbi:ABC transporter ATP-binding protein [Chloracidobacterium thermophilum]|uniref:ABC transporter ATP-binding protein n=1 Tax=Chloracidobacterium thermophilum TaxID=458033 RepID=UPI0007385456|nr:ABC transporter ATP-binding protein [Chloracidobacterium thermophilum]